MPTKTLFVLCCHLVEEAERWACLITANQLDWHSVWLLMLLPSKEEKPFESEIVLHVLEEIPLADDIPITYWEFSIGESEGNWRSAFHNILSIRRKRIVWLYLFRLSASVALADGRVKSRRVEKRIARRSLFIWLSSEKY